MTREKLDINSRGGSFNYLKTKQNQRLKCQVHSWHNGRHFLIIGTSYQPWDWHIKVLLLVGSLK